MNDLLQAQFVGAYELREKLPQLLAALTKDQKELVITQNGKPAGVMQSVAGYLRMKMLIEELEEAVKESTDFEYWRELAKDKKTLLQGRGVSAQKVFAKLNL
jgi:prevent-host-death family protein